MKETVYTDYTRLAEEALENFYNSPYKVAPLPEDRPHVVSIARSIMLDRDGVIPGGGFVKAVNANDLEAAVSRADSVTIQHLAFFVNCKRFIHLQTL